MNAITHSQDANFALSSLIFSTTPTNTTSPIAIPTTYEANSTP
jgi:hypothetical protein